MADPSWYDEGKSGAPLRRRDRRRPPAGGERTTAGEVGGYESSPGDRLREPRTPLQRNGSVPVSWHRTGADRGPGIHGDELRRVRIHELAGNQPGPGPRAPRRVPALHRLWRRNRLPRR